MSRIIDVGVARGDFAYVLHTGLLMVAFALAGLAGGALCSVFAAKASISMSGRMRLSLFAKIQGLSFAEIDGFKTSSLVTRMTNDVMQLQQTFLMMLRVMVRSPLTFFGSVIMAYYLSPRLAIVFAVILPVVTVCVAVLMRKASRAFASAQKSLDRINTIMRENLLGARVVKAFTLERDQESRFSDANEDLRVVSVRAQRIAFLLLPIITLVMNLSVVFALWRGGTMVVSGDIEIGKIMAFVNYLVQITHSLVMAAALVVILSRAGASAERIGEVFEARNSVAESDGARGIGRLDLEFRHVSFAYRGSAAMALTDVSFTAMPGETVGIVGATGSGKSTIASLIPRLYDATEGQILLGGTDVRDLRIDELRKRIGVAMQESVLFSGTVDENLRFGGESAPLDEIDRACEDAQASGFLAKGPTGYDGAIEQRGKNFSGGQKQRMSIARTLLRDPDVLVLDDSTSAIDLKTEARLRAAIARRMRGKTVIVIAQRLSSVMNADRILVVDFGRLVAAGTHRELLRSCDIYRSIAISQFGEEALADVD
jgi:ATP-binding cassette subfamily B protein